MIIQQLFLEV